jgi:ferredoxin-type protein NapG
MDRRAFLRLGADKAAEIKAELVSDAPAWPGDNWIRPPFAEAERDFLINCTRCDKCIAACEFDVLFKLPGDLPHPAAGTPAMDLLNHGCHMCDGWPCVAACEPDALRQPPSTNSAAPKFARAEIDTEQCLPYQGPECGACADSCLLEGGLEWRRGGRPVINSEICSGCGACREACIVSPKAVTISLLA